MAGMPEIFSKGEAAALVSLSSITVPKRVENQKIKCYNGWALPPKCLG